MTIQSIVIDKLTEEKVEDGTLKKKVGFKVTNDKGNLFIIDKWFDINSDWDKDKYCSEAYKSCESEINEWKDGLTEVGKTFDPDSGKIQ